MADITVDVNLPSTISVDVTSPTQVLATNISIPGPQGPRGEKGNPTSINSLTAENIIITGVDGNMVFTTGLNTIFISGNSGYFQSAVNSLTTNLNNTGANLNTSINNLSGLFTGYTGTLDATYATDSQLNSTGSTLNIKIDNLSGYVNSQDINISNNLASTGSSLQSNINTLSSNLNSTGSNLENKITSLSGTLTSNYATITNLASTGSTLVSSINSLNSAFTGFTGNLDATYATDSQLTSTGSTLVSSINSLSGYINSSSSNIVFTTGNQTISGSKIFASPIVFPSGANDGIFLGGAGGTIDLRAGAANDGGAGGSGGNIIMKGGDGGVDANSGAGGPAGSIDLSGATGGDGAAGGGGSIILVGAYDSSNAGSINLSAGGGGAGTHGGSITSTGSEGGGSGGTLNMSASQFRSGGSIDTSSGGSINTSNDGGSINTSNNGGSIDTRAGTTNAFAGGSGGDIIMKGGDGGLPNTGGGVGGNAGSIDLSGYTGDDGAGGDGGSITLVGGYDGGDAGSIDLSGGNAGHHGGSIISIGTNEDHGGTLNMSANGYGEGGSISTAGGGSINTSNGGGSIDTTSGFIELGIQNERTTLRGTASTNITISLPNASGTLALDSNVAITGSTLNNSISSLSGTLTGNYATINNLASTGSTLVTNLASTGSTLDTKINTLSGSSVLLYGNQSVGGVKTFRDNVYINNLFVTGTETIVSTNNFNVQSPYVLLNLTGGAVDGGIFFVTGSGLTGINNTGPIIGFDHSNKFKFGVSTRNSDLSTLPDIASVQDIQAYSGVADNKFSTIINLANTGSTLVTSINSLSGTLTSDYATITNLASTGSTLNAKINNLSGYINSSSSNIVFTTGNQTVSGIKTFTNNLEVQGTGIFNALDLSNISDFSFSGVTINLINSTVQSSGQIYISGNPVLTGVNLSSYATITNLASTGSTLNSNINSLSGTLTGNYLTTSSASSTYATITNLASTGSTLNNTINSLSGTVTGNYVTKSNGQFINRPTVNGTGVLLSGEAAALPNTILYTTGNQIKSGRLAIGDTIVDENYPYTLSVQSNNNNTWLEILNHSGSNKGVFFGIEGNDFEQYNWQAGDIKFFTSENFSDGTERLRIKNDGKVGIGTSSPSEKLQVVGNILANNLVYNTGNQTISGNKNFVQNVIVGDQTQDDLLVVSGNEISFGVIPTVSGNPLLTGIDLSSYATVANLASTGSTLDTKINNLSGYINSSSSNIVFTTGNQFVDGLKSINNSLYLNNINEPKTLFSYDFSTMINQTGASVAPSFDLQTNVISAGNMTRSTGISGFSSTVGWGAISFSINGSTVELAINNYGEYYTIPIYSNANQYYYYGAEIYSINPLIVIRSPAGPKSMALMYGPSADPVFATVIDSGINIIPNANANTDISPVFNQALKNNKIKLSPASNSFLFLVPYQATGNGGTLRFVTQEGGADLAFKGLNFGSNFSDSSLKINTDVNMLGKLDLNKNKLVNSISETININSNFTITDAYNGRIVLTNSATTTTGTLVPGIVSGFNMSIIQGGVGKVQITGNLPSILLNSFNNQFKTAGRFANVSLLNTGNDGYILYGNTSV